MNHMCKLAPSCKVAGNPNFCHALCSPFILLHGEGHNGLWKATNVPSKYKNAFFDTLPIEQENKGVYGLVKAYKANILENVRKGTGLFFYSIPNAENKLGTGTGKTTTAITLLHEYLLARVKEQATGGKVIEKNPALFYKASELQNLYNSQFRGTFDMQEKASLRYYKVKHLLMTCELLVLDDIGIRQKVTDAFENELTEIIDARDSNVLMTIYTSNLPISAIGENLGERIASRIEGMTIAVQFVGKDHRRGGLL